MCVEQTLNFQRNAKTANVSIRTEKIHADQMCEPQSFGDQHLLQHVSDV